MAIYQHLFRGFQQIAFPATCTGCGRAVESGDFFLCEICLTDGFDDPNPADEPACGRIILPENVSFQDAMWVYDKEGVLQRLMRMVKYEGLGEAGIFLGRVAAQRIGSRHLNHRMGGKDGSLLLPVPIHQNRKKKRGYNQAEKIARGISEVLDIPLAPESALIRVKHTATQTRYSFDKRMQNLKGAFQLQAPDVFRGKNVLIVDDVFTTGSTCFSLAEVLGGAEPASIGIFTIGMA
jgi:ComF family protein